MNFYLLLPEIAMAILAIGLVVLDLVVSDKSKSRLGYVAVVGLAITAVLVAMVGRTPGVSFFGTVAVDPLSVLFQFIFLLSAALVILSSIDYIRRRSRYQGEFYALIIFATLGAMFLASSTELITLYIALELMSISQFILAGFLKNNTESSEAGMKYLLLGALSSAVLLYGLALLYGATGVTTLTGIRDALAKGPSQLALMGVGLLIAGFGFKLVVVPFQMYVPDVYQGAPTPVTMFISVASKIAAFSIVLRVFGIGLQPFDHVWPALFAILAALTMTVGNVAALRQTNIKRMMGYSSIGQAGYALTGLAVASHTTTTGLLFFLIAYAVTNLGVFVAIVYYSNRLGSDDLADYAGLSRRSPLMALALAVCLLSLVGLPPMVGFWSKVYLFLSVFDVGVVWLVILGLLNSALAAFYYLKIVHAMYMKPPTVDKPLAADPPLTVAMAVAIVAVFVTGIIPGPFIQAASSAASVLFPS
ncbi:MAG: NADH-quinone oxidoreductase subunit N [Chloroflexota bacterium]